MYTQIKTSFLFYTFTLFMCISSFLVRDTAAQVSESVSDNYTFETIDVPGVDFLAVTASSDFEDYAGYTRDANGKEVGWTLIDGVWTTYNFPGSQKTHFYALGNNGTVAGHFMDSEGLYHGVILEDGKLTQYDFPDATETQIYGYSDATGALTGNFIDASGVRRGFSEDEIIEFPGATATYADFVAVGTIVGSYVDAEGLYHGYARFPDGRFVSFDLPGASNQVYTFVHGISDSGLIVARGKAVGDVPRTYTGSVSGLKELQFPGAVSTEGWNINQDGSVVGHYDSADGSRHGFIARLAEEETVLPDVSPVDTRDHLNVVSLRQNPDAVSPRISVDIHLSDGKRVAGYNAFIVFDATVLKYVSATMGDYLQRDGIFIRPVLSENDTYTLALDVAGETQFGTTLTLPVGPDDGDKLALSNFFSEIPPEYIGEFVPPTYLHADGQYWGVSVIGSAPLRPDGKPIASSGDGTLVTFTFEVLDPQKAAFILLPEGSLFGDDDAPLPVIHGNLLWENAVHSTDVNGDSTDVNGDGVVNILDLVKVAGEFGQPVTDANRSADVNGDGVVNILDLVKVASDFGKSATTEFGAENGSEE